MGYLDDNFLDWILGQERIRDQAYIYVLSYFQDEISGNGLLANLDTVKLRYWSWIKRGEEIIERLRVPK